MPFFAATAAMLAPMAVTPAPTIAVDFTAIDPTDLRKPGDILLPIDVTEGLRVDLSLDRPAGTLGLRDDGDVRDGGLSRHGSASSLFFAAPPALLQG